MPAAIPEQKVLIVGGGLSGLALAQILRKHGIAYELFDRDASAAAETRGYSIMIRESLEAMRHVMPDDLPDAEESISVLNKLRAPSSLAGFTFGGEPLNSMVSPGPEDPQRRFVRANRTRMREWLALKLHVQWNKKFARYEETDAGVTVFFTDGSSAQGTLLVGADGSRSKIRSQLVGPANGVPSIAPYIILSSEFSLPKAEYEEVLKHGNGAQAFIGAGIRAMIGVKHVADDLQTADIFLIFMLEDATVSAQGASHWTQSASKAELHAFTLEKTRDVAPRVRALFERLTADKMVTPAVNFLEWAPAEPALPGTRVALMGDALHTMLPFRGAGANTAIRDAVDLGQFVALAHRQGRDFADVVRPYERIAVPRGVELVVGSAQAGDPAKWIQDGIQRLANPFVWEPITEADFP